MRIRTKGDAFKTTIEDKRKPKKFTIGHCKTLDLINLLTLYSINLHEKYNNSVISIDKFVLRILEIVGQNYVNLMIQENIILQSKVSRRFNENNSARLKVGLRPTELFYQ